MNILGETWFLEVFPEARAGAIVVLVGRAIDTGVGTDGDFPTTGVDALADCWLPPAGPAPVGVLAHVDAGATALCDGILLALFLEFCGLEVGGHIEGFMVPLGVARQGGRGEVGGG